MARVLITGCSTGFGRATAVELTKRGHEVLATARRPETLEDLDVAEKMRLDVDEDGSVSDTVKAAGRVDALVNNAGFGITGPVEHVPLPELRRMFETNVVGALRMIQAVLPQMRERGSGTIVNVTSLAGLVTPPTGGAYSATKHALEALSEAHSSSRASSRPSSRPRSPDTASTTRRTTSSTGSGKRRSSSSRATVPR